MVGPRPVTKRCGDCREDCRQVPPAANPAAEGLGKGFSVQGLGHRKREGSVFEDMYSERRRIYVRDPTCRKMPDDEHCSIRMKTNLSF